MSGLDKTIIDFSEAGLAGSGVIAITGTSASATLPLQTELLLLTSTASGAHFRCSVGASTALVTDPMITQGITLVVKLNPDLAYTLSAIGDTGVTTGNVSYTRVMEG